MSNVLVIEDDPEIRRLIAEILGYEGFSVSTAENGTMGERLARQDPPDVIVCDIIMPELDGFGVLKALQANPQTATIPFIFLTAFSDPRNLRNGMRLGADDYLVKPVDPDDLIASIRTRLVKRQIAQQWRMDLSMPPASAPETAMNALAADTTTQLFNNGKTIGNYRLLNVIGEGACGIVFLCERTSDGSRHALKILKMDIHNDKSREALVRRFVNEANAVAQLNHPNIVNFIEFGYSDNGPDNIRSPYVVMEYFPGASLESRLETGIAWDYKQKIMVILQIACALTAVHAKNIIHRDIKPGNILIDDNLAVKITDFGICHLPSSDLTLTSNILGTPCYLSPKYLATGKADHLDDIYSLGIVAYELLVGVRPFDSKNVTHLLRIIQKDLPVEPCKVKPDFPFRIQEILAKMLKKKAKQRYQSVSELVDDLIHFEKNDRGQGGLLGRLASGLLDGKDWQ